MENQVSVEVDQENEREDTTENGDLGIGRWVRRSRDFSERLGQLKADHERRPLWVTPTGRVLLETFSPVYKYAYDFIIAIAEPVTRPRFIHEYQIKALSLYAAASVGLRTDDIISGLERLSKTSVDPALCNFIKECTARCGKVRLVLQENRYFVESIYPDALEFLLNNPTINAARIDHFTSNQSAASSIYQRDEETGFLILTGPLGAHDLHLPGTASDKRIDQSAAMGLGMLEENEESNENIDTGISSTKVLSFEVSQEHVQNVRRVCLEMRYPLLEEYEFRKDAFTPTLAISLKPAATIRPYQEKSLSKMFGNGRARSGIIVLPCGAGKTLVGITATATVRKSAIVFCNTGVSVDQWKRQFLHWANIPEKAICVFTSSIKDEIPRDQAVLLLTTYSMIAYSGHRGIRAQRIIDEIQRREWGLLVLDEVHVAPARTFRRCVEMTHSRCKLGLTATLLREDDLIDDLLFLLGPKLYEANWLSLQQSGYLATVQCVEVRCPMTAEFFKNYLENQSNARRQLLTYVCNPNKFRACEYLIRWHERRGDKILVFSDNIFALEKFAKELHRPFIHGKTRDGERLDFLHHLQSDENLNTLFISKVGDTSIDLPDVNVLIQISSHFASRRQEAQRLGRILRPKSSSSSSGNGGFNAYFYTLVSEDTKEMVYATKRQSFLIDQGYAFKVVTDIVDASDTSLRYSSAEEQRELLAQIMAVENSAGEVEDLNDADEQAWFDEFSKEHSERQQQKAKKPMNGSSLSRLSGAQSAIYDEVQRGGSLLAKKKRDAARKRKADEERRLEADELRREREEADIEQKEYQERRQAQKDAERNRLIEAARR